MKPLQYMLIILVIMMFASPVFSSDEQLVLVDDQIRIELSIESLRKQANIEFTLFAPFRGREVRVRGFLLDTLLKKHLLRVPERIKLTAYDGYDLTFDNWQPNHWVIVTHEDGQPLSLRQQGPLRLIERDYTGRDPKNLRNFNDWVWMLRGIETLP